LLTYAEADLTYYFKNINTHFRGGLKVKRDPSGVKSYARKKF